MARPPENNGAQMSKLHILGFAANAPAMCGAGWAVLPARGKEPIRKGYRKWRRAPASTTVAKWADENPEADIVYLPGLSRGKRSSPGIVVVDADDDLACQQVLETFGDTPGKVRTRRGRHFQYRDTGFDFGKLTSLKKLGINADIKHGNSIVVAPWSRHQEDRAFVYRWDGCDQTVIRDLPPFKGQVLQRLLDNLKPPQVEPVNLRGADLALRDGSRKLGLNDRLVALVWSVSSEMELTVAACAIAEEIGCANPRGQLGPDEVLEVARTVWRDREHGEIEDWGGIESREKRRRREIELLHSIDPEDAPLAYTLLDVLRDEHAARCRRGETFALSVKAMERAGVIPGWSWRKYGRARDLLLKAGLIELVHGFVDTAAGRLAAQYKLCWPNAVGRSGGGEC